MWILQYHEGPQGRIHYLPCGPTLMVSRKDGHILLVDDDSISRKHATVTVTHEVNNLKNPSILPTVVVKDLNSKYGTFVNDGIDRDCKIVDERLLEKNDRIRFGMRTSIWNLKYQELVVTTSALQSESKKELQQSLVTLGGHLLGEWSESCSYLVMDNITLTIKVVCALAAARNIVTPAFFKHWAEAALKKTDPPKPSMFEPPLQEMSINQGEVSFSPNEARKCVFARRTFLFASTKQMKRMGLAITLAGGIVLMLSEDNYQSVTQPNHLLIQVPEKNQDPNRVQFYAKAKEILKSKKLRVIPEADVGLAILYVSTESHCNPSFMVANILRRNTSSMTQSQGGIQIYATETQDREQNSVSLTGTRIVPESGVSSTRRTTGTLPSTSVSVPATTVPDSSLNLSGTNTASLSSLSKRNEPMKSNSDNKESDFALPSKRRRTSQGNIPSKPIMKPPDNEVKLYEPTQPLDSQDVEEKENSADLGISTFAPRHSSTQKCDVPDNTRSRAKDRVIAQELPEKQVTVKDDHGDRTMCRGLVSSLEPTLGRSIPFEPFTLPSLVAEDCKDVDITHEPFPDDDDIATQHYTRIKEEPCNSPVEEENGPSGKRRRGDDDMEVPDENGPTWFERKRRKEEGGVENQVKSERRSFNGGLDIGMPRIKQECNNYDDLFALPSTSNRKRNRDQDKRKRPEETAEDAGGGDLFDLPQSSRAERRSRKALKMEAPTSPEADVSRGSSSEAATMQNNLKNNKENSSAKDQEMTSTSANDPWISRTTAVAPTANTTVSVKGEAMERDQSRRSESKSDVIAEVTKNFEDKVCVTPLVKQRLSASVSSTRTEEVVTEGLKNFKRFRKCTRDVAALPKIIGGKALVSHHVIEVSSKRNDWFLQNPDVTAEIEREEATLAIENENNDFFNLTPRPGRHRGRRAI